MPRKRNLFGLGHGALAVVLLAGQVAAAAPHPLDPLSEDEIAATIKIIADSGRVDRTTRAVSIGLAEPAKPVVLGWDGTSALPRRAFTVLRVAGRTVEATVNLDTGQIDNWHVDSDGQTAITSAEWARAQEVLKADPRWRKAMRVRGYKTFDRIFCDSLSAGNFGRPEETERRILKMPCYDTAGTAANVYARPIEGVLSTVDLDRWAVVSVSDSGLVPVPDRVHEFATPAAERDRAPHAGPAPGIRMDGRLISWRAWSFHLGFDQRFGPVLSLVRHNSGTRGRSVLYEAHISEIFVPYMDPDPNWAFRSYLDAGEYGLGTLTSKLAPGIDCPDGATFVDAVLVSPAGRPYRKERALCVFERPTGAPLWRHAEALTRVYAGRPAADLVVRSIPSIAHYDYIIDWVFRESGEIAVEIGATGIDAVKAVPFASMAAESAEVPYGTLVAPGLVAVHHDHYFSVRLDLDVDGPVNRFRRDRFLREALPADRRRRSIWRLDPDPMASEGPVRGGGPQLWRVENADRVTALGHHPAYQIQYAGPTSLLAPDDPPQYRAAFSGAPLWLTVRKPGERFAAGAYPNQSPGGAGLPVYAGGERIDDADLVAWVTMGFRHVTRPEDWPVLSTVRQTLLLRPFGFFERNPSVNTAAVATD